MIDTTEPIISEETIQRILSIVPPLQIVRRGREAYDPRKTILAVAYRFKTGCAWRGIPKKLGNWSTIFSRYRQWRLAGVAEQVEREIQRALSQERLIP